MKIHRINQFQPQILFYFLENNFEQFILEWLMPFQNENSSMRELEIELY